MSAYLLDVNVLVALIWPAHAFHASVHTWFSRHSRRGWSTCPITQAGFVRVVSNPSFSRDAVSPEEALSLLADNLQRPSHQFWPDGIGIDEKVLNEGARAGHWGLPGVRERAKLAGAQLDFWSEVGAGTEVQLTVPASVAYAKSPEARIFGIFRKQSRSHGE